MAQWPGIKFYFDDIPSIEMLGDEIGEFFLGCMKYGQTGEEPMFSGASRILWPMMKSKIDRDRKKYEDTCKTNAYNRYKGSCKGELLSQDEWEEQIYLPRLTTVNDRQRSSPTVNVTGDVTGDVNVAGDENFDENFSFTENEKDDGKGKRGKPRALRPLPDDEDARFERRRAELLAQIEGI